MSIQITTLKGTNSLSADRITINDNFKINTDAINNLLGIIDTTTGKFDNTGVGADSTITTEGLTITTGAGIELQSGSITLNTGNILLNSDGASIGLGSDNSKIIDKIVAIGASGPNSTHIIGATGFIATEIPSMTTAELTDVGVNGLGATGPYVITFDSDTANFKGWNGTAWVILG